MGCWAHARRGFRDAKDLAPGFCLEVLKEIAKLYAVEAEAREEADRRAKKIVSIAIERMAGEIR